MEKSHLICPVWICPMLGSSLCVWEKAVMKKALNAILFIAAGWALNTGTHSFEEAEGGGTLAKLIHLCGPVNTNSAFRKREPKIKNEATEIGHSRISILHVQKLRIAREQVRQSAAHIHRRQEAPRSASCDSTCKSMLERLSTIFAVLEHLKPERCAEEPMHHSG